MGDEADEAIDAIDDAFALDDPFGDMLSDQSSDDIPYSDGIPGIHSTDPYADEVPGVDGKDENPPCPKCDDEMVERNGPRGPFWGCRNFPACRGTRPMKHAISQPKVETLRLKADALNYIVKATACLKAHATICKICDDIAKGRLV